VTRAARVVIFFCLLGGAATKVRSHVSGFSVLRRRRVELSVPLHQPAGFAGSSFSAVIAEVSRSALQRPVQAPFWIEGGEMEF
jgi:hypothetical protein